MKLTKGTILKAHGGWDAEVVWIIAPRTSFNHLIDKEETLPPAGFYAVHQPGVVVDLASSDGESCPVWHSPDGVAAATLVVNDPPRYGESHSADLEMGEYEL